ncbi:MAG: FtsX-like permease family protein [Spirochaetes bacterium]|nr:FtsX-like permease family protein [Spirochaetota bacterium]
MTWHYLRLALRRLRRDASYALVNFLSLVAGLTCCFAFLLLITHELGYDRDFSASDRLYRIAYKSTFSDIASEHARGPSALSPALEQSFPAVEATASLIEMQDVLARRATGDIALQNLFRATPDFFEVFDFPLLHGDAETALTEPGTIVLTHDAAMRLFGNANAVGRTVTFDTGRTYEVTGVLAPNLPRSHLRFEALLYTPKGLLSLWNGFVALTYVQLRPGAEIDPFSRRLNAYIDRHAQGRWGEHLDAFLQHVPWIHLTSHLEGEVQANGSLRMLGVLALAALLTLLMAVLNYLNLSTARAADRGKEIGIRKAVGADQRQLARQFLGESVFITLLAAPVALLLLLALRPLLYRFTGILPSWNGFTFAVVTAGALLLCIIVGLGAGSYPAAVLSGFDPVRALRGEGFSSGARSRAGGFAWPRRILVSSQLFVTLLFVLTSTVVVTQLRYMTTKDLGFDPEQVLNVRLWDRVSTDRFETLRRILLDHAAVQSVSYGSLPGEHTGGFAARDPSGRSLLVHRFHIGPRYTETLGIDMADGKPFSPDHAAESGGLLVNESAARLLSVSTGSQLKALGELQRVEGIMQNFHFFSLHQPIPPIHALLSDDVGPYLLIRKKQRASVPAVRRALEEVWSRFLPDTPFTPRLLADQLKTAYVQERRLAQLLAAFSTVAIAIAYLGLFAMVSYVLQRRKREIAIRRALGATALRLGLKLSAESAGVYVISAVAALGTMLVASSWWLRQFAFRASPSPLALSLVLLVVLLITLTAVWYHVVRIAATPPAQAIRDS